MEQEFNYNRIEEAIRYLTENHRQQPTLEEVAAHVHVSPYHFQRLFSEWAGVSPKKFLQYLNVEYAKTVLKEKGTTLFDVAEQTGLSAPSRLHDLFINIEGMTPGEYKNGGENLHINYSFAETPFGQILVASTDKGICEMSFVKNEHTSLEELKMKFPSANYKQMLDSIQQNALFVFTQDWSQLQQIKLHLKATPFQLKVWSALLRIPLGTFTSYNSIAKCIESSNASRAVGTAIGNNPVAFLIPCHRVIQATGNFGGYRWGSLRKSAMLCWEASKVNN
jgi:AraC family transcriptional regulator, regulatory protein of adaptative response / methylated-DNA-[protein]-cysteine methyltransferase